MSIYALLLFHHISYSNVCYYSNVCHTIVTDCEMTEGESSTCSETLENDSPTVPIPAHQMGQTSSPIHRRKRKHSSHIERRLARRQGLQYQRLDGKIVNKKEFTFISCNCRNKCSDLSKEKRQKIFSDFWNIGDWQAQSNYIAGCARVSEPQRKSVTHSRVSNIRQYYLADTRVCKEVFLNTQNNKQESQLLH